MITKALGIPNRPGLGDKYQAQTTRRLRTQLTRQDMSTMDKITMARITTGKDKEGLILDSHQGSKHGSFSQRQ
jgi:hypothetical protein